MVRVYLECEKASEPSIKFYSQKQISLTLCKTRVQTIGNTSSDYNKKKFQNHLLQLLQFLGFPLFKILFPGNFPAMHKNDKDKFLVKYDQFSHIFEGPYSTLHFAAEKCDIVPQSGKKFLPLLGLKSSSCLLCVRLR